MTPVHSLVAYAPYGVGVLCSLFYLDRGARHHCARTRRGGMMLLDASWSCSSAGVKCV